MAVAAPPPEETHFVRQPVNVLREIASRPDWIHPDPTHITTAAQIIQDSNSRRDAFGTILDVTTDVKSGLVIDSTETLVAMFQSNHQSIPEHWRANPEIMRTIISMAANIELGILRAEEIHHSSSEKTKLLSKSRPGQIKNLEDLLNQLQEKATGTGESGKMMM